jgi:hypothetical protein
LAARLANWELQLIEAERQLTEYQVEIDDIALRLYGIERQDQWAIQERFGTLEPSRDGVERDPDTEDEATATEPIVASRQLITDLLSYAVGCTCGRWDVRFVTEEQQPPVLPDPFAPLPVCSPGMLTGNDGLLLCKSPLDYPLRVSWDGILVDDLGPDDANPRREDIVRRVREILDLIWGAGSEAIEQEVCEILGVRDLREYFRRPTGFFDDHRKRYSKSRR